MVVSGQEWDEGEVSGIEDSRVEKEISCEDNEEEARQKLINERSTRVEGEKASS